MFVLIYVAVTGSQTSGESLKMEMSQAGFSAVYVPGVINNLLDNTFIKAQTLSLCHPVIWLHSMTFGDKHICFIYLQGQLQLATVGANQWKGGYRTYTTAGQRVSSQIPSNMEPNSYLGKDINAIV